MSPEEIRALVQAEIAAAEDRLRLEFEDKLIDLRQELTQTGRWDPNW